MRPLKTNEEAFGMGNLTGGNSLVPAVQELWNTWEIHCLILVSLSLQAFLFLFADMRRRSSSRVLRTVLWLAYLAADSVAIFVLGHLAVHAGQPRHQLMSFWAPFVLVHLGGQDTITAFSREDNELWKRHLLSLVTQVAVAVYVLAKASWPDVRLRAAMLLIFVSGCFRSSASIYANWDQVDNPLVGNTKSANLAFNPPTTSIFKYACSKATSFICCASLLTEMRPLKTNEEAFGIGNLTGENSLVPAVQELWNTWEIHCLILVSLSLQAFLFIFADMRRRSSSRVLRTVLWLAYLAADTVAIFVLGHLAVHAGQPRHQLMSFWAPFVLVHLGGQDTITAFSRQDNELWKRHLLALVTQVAVAGYVVAKASWPDVRLRAAMVLIFLSGCFRYAERTRCLYRSSPARLRSEALDGWSPLNNLREVNIVSTTGRVFEKKWDEALDISKGGSSGLGLFKQYDKITIDLLSGDVPDNLAEIGGASLTVKPKPVYKVQVYSVGEDHQQSMLQQFQANPGRCRVYEHVGALLVHAYLTLYTKIPFRKFLFIDSYLKIYDRISSWRYSIISRYLLLNALLSIGSYVIFVLYTLFQFASAPIALVLFWAAEKGSQNQLLHTSRADITVSYILLIGAIALDASATISTLPSYYQIPAAWCNKKQWSEKLGQYSIIKRHVRLPEVTHIPMISKDDGGGKEKSPSPIKEFILDKIIGFGTKKQWNIASFRGQWAIKEWMDTHGIPDSERPTKALAKTTSNGITDFPTSVLIWHIATEICYYNQYGSASTTSSPNAQLTSKKHKQISRELSNYIMYLIFKRRVMLTTNSQLVHDLAHNKISKLTDVAEKKIEVEEFVAKLFDATKSQEKERQDDMAGENQDHQHQVPATSSLDNSVASNRVEKLVQNAYSVLPRASELAQELIGISNETERWELIASVWAEMAYYTAPRCGAAFHYEHLSTGGEFITHLLVLMYILGPFLPEPDA